MKIFNDNYFIKKIKKICEFKIDQSIKNFTSIKIGGTANIAYPKNVKQLKKLITFLKKNKKKYMVIGNGTNLVFSDKKHEVILISLKHFKNIKQNDNRVIIASGVSLFYLCQFCQINSLGGAEFLYGIPGSVGGAIKMNAGAFDKEIKNIVLRVWVLKDDKVSVLSLNQCKFDYRHSIFFDKNYIILKVELNLIKKDCLLIKHEMNDILQTRHSIQPYNTLNAGSIFKKCNNESAGKYIDNLGLKGYKIGDIQISDRHANFFVNCGNAKFYDFENMVNEVKTLVKKIYGINLNLEVIVIK